MVNGCKCCLCFVVNATYLCWLLCVWHQLVHSTAHGPLWVKALTSANVNTYWCFKHPHVRACTCSATFCHWHNSYKLAWCYSQFSKNFKYGQNEDKTKHCLHVRSQTSTLWQNDRKIVITIPRARTCQVTKESESKRGHEQLKTVGPWLAASNSWQLWVMASDWWILMRICWFTWAPPFQRRLQAANVWRPQERSLRLARWRRCPTSASAVSEEHSIALSLNKRNIIERSENIHWCLGCVGESAVHNPWWHTTKVHQEIVKPAIAGMRWLFGILIGVDVQLLCVQLSWNDTFYLPKCQVKVSLNRLLDPLVLHQP